MWKFLVSSSNKENWPNKHAKEVCFIGRSNVGKSSLINAITKINGIARVSNTPGRTRLLNFFQEDNMILVDLPGYGFAKMSNDKKHEMILMIEDYLQNRRQLVKVFSLIDAKIGPTEDDVLMLRYLQDQKLSVTCVITKSDKANQSQLHSTQKKIRELSDDFIVTSTYSGQNIAQLRKIIASQF